MTVLKKPVITEKMTKIAEKNNRITFKVDKEATKATIKNEVERLYNVKVAAINTMIMPGKAKRRYTKAGVLSGYKPSYKKAIITIAEGYKVDLFNEIN